MAQGRKNTNGTNAASWPVWNTAISKWLLVPCCVVGLGCSEIGGFETISGDVLDENGSLFSEPPFLVWQKSYATKAIAPADIAIAGDKLWLSGTYTGPLDFGGGELVSGTGMATHVFVAQFDGNGKHVGSVGTTPTSANQFATGFALTGTSALVSGVCEDGIRIGGCTYNAAAGEEPQTYLAPIDEMMTCSGMITRHVDPMQAMSGAQVATDGTAIFAAFASTGSTSLRTERPFPEAPSPWKTDFTAPMGEPSPTITASTMTARNGIVITGGDFVGKVQIKPGLAVDSPVTTDIFLIAQQESTNEVIWGKSFGGPDEQHLHAATQSYVKGVHDLYLAGSFAGNLQLDATTLSPTGGKDAFVARVDPATGAVRKALRFGDSSDQVARAIAFDALTERVIVGGTFRGTIDVDGHVIKNATIDDRAFLMVLNADLAVVHLKSYGTSGAQLVTSVDAADGNIYLTGTYTGDVNFGDPDLTLSNPTSVPALFMTRLKL